MLSKQERALIIHWHEEKKASIRTISRRLGVSRNTVRHWLRAESKTEEPKARSQLGKFLQEHSADVREMYVNCELHCPPLRRCIKDRYQVDVPLRMLQRYCAPLRKELKRLTYLEDTVCRFETAPGQHLQVDFGEKDVLVNGQPEHLHLFTCKLGYSRRVFVKAYLRETQEAWLDGMESAFRYFGGLPYCIVCDNAPSLVRNHNAGSDAARFTQRFYYFLSYYNIKGIATAIQHPQSKGKVESGVKYVKNNAVVGVDKPDLASWNIWLETWAERNPTSEKSIRCLAVRIHRQNVGYWKNKRCAATTSTALQACFLRLERLAEMVLSESTTSTSVLMTHSSGWRSKSNTMKRTSVSVGPVSKSQLWIRPKTHLTPRHKKRQAKIIGRVQTKSNLNDS